MAGLLGLLGRATASGAAASVTSGLALAAVAKAEGRGAFQPINATSHWLHGSRAAQVQEADLTHTAVGYATHAAATFLWAALFEGLRTRRGAPVPLARDAALVASVAAAVDYLATPKRFTPGWEYVLSKRSMALVYAALGAGLALGALAAERIEARARR